MPAQAGIHAFLSILAYFNRTHSSPSNPLPLNGGGMGWGCLFVGPANPYAPPDAER